MTTQPDKYLLLWREDSKSSVQGKTAFMSMFLLCEAAACHLQESPSVTAGNTALVLGLSILPLETEGLTQVQYWLTQRDF